MISIPRIFTALLSLTVFLFLLSCDQVATPAGITSYSFARVRNSANLADQGSLELSGAQESTAAIVANRPMVFVAGLTDHGISVLEVASNGALSSLYNLPDDNTNRHLRSPYALDTAQIGDTTYLFTTSFAEDAVNSYEVASNGTLTLRGSAVDGGALELDGAYALTTASVGDKTFVFVAGNEDDGISSFEVATNGSLTSRSNVSDTSSTNLESPRSLITAQVDNRTFLAVASDLDDGISIYEVSSTGALTNRDNVKDIGGGVNYRFNGSYALASAQIQDKTYIFVGGFDDDGITVFELSSTGILTFRSSLDDSQNSQYQLDGLQGLSVVQLRGKTFLSAVSFNDSGMSLFEVDDLGQLENVANISDSQNGDYLLRAATSVSSLVTNNRAYLFITGSLDSGISAFEAQLE